MSYLDCAFLIIALYALFTEKPVLRFELSTANFSLLTQKGGAQSKPGLAGIIMKY